MGFSPLPPTQLDDDDDDDVVMHDVRRTKVRQLIDEDDGGGEPSKPTNSGSTIEESDEEEEEYDDDNEELVDYKKQLFEMEAEESGLPCLETIASISHTMLPLFQAVKTRRRTKTTMKATAMTTKSRTKNCRSSSTRQRSKWMKLNSTTWPKFICTSSVAMFRARIDVQFSLV